MKKYHSCLILIIGVVIIIGGCKTNRFLTSSEVWTIRQENDILVLGARGYADSERDAILNAEKRAFETLFFRGIPNSSYKLPMVPEGNSGSSFIAGFFESGAYRNFITSSTITTPLVKNKIKKTKELSIEMSVNAFALRRHLEQNGVIKKFGL